MAMANAIVHWEIGATDAPKMLEFCRQMFDWDIDTTNPMYASAAPSDGGIGGGVMQSQPGVSPYVTVYVAVGDLAAALA
jgi:hypothetical protein